MKDVKKIYNKRQQFILSAHVVNIFILPTDPIFHAMIFGEKQKFRFR